MSFSDTSEAEPKSQILTTVLFSLTCNTMRLSGNFDSDSIKTDQDIVWLNVGVHDICLFQQRQSKEQLVSVRADSTNVQSNVLAKLFNNISEVHTMRMVSSGTITLVITNLRDSNTRQR